MSRSPSKFTIRKPPQPKYMTRVRTAKGSLYLQCWGLPLFLLNCFSINKYICLYVYDTLGTMQGIFRVVFQNLVIKILCKFK